MMPKDRDVGTVSIVTAVVCFTFVLTGGCGFSALVRPQSRSEQLRAARIRPERHSLHASRGPRPVSYTHLTLPTILLV